MYLWHHCILGPHPDENIVGIRYMDTDFFVFSFNPIEDLIYDLKHFSKTIDLSETNSYHDYYSEDNKMILG